MDRRPATAVAPRISALSLAIRLGVAGLMMGLASPQASAACTPASPALGDAVTCTGTATILLDNTFSSAVNNLTVGVTVGSTINALLGGTAMNLAGNNITLNNAGTIDPSILGLITLLSNGTVIGSGASGTVSVTNLATGIMKGTSGLLGVGLSTLNGMALNINNGATGTTTITNNGAIGSAALLGLSLFASDAPVIAVQGGSRVNMTNTGTVTGRMAFEASAGGNTFFNSGNIIGGLSMGAASTNTFTAVIGSTVSSGGGLGLALGGLLGVNLGFAPTGQIDGGLGGSNALVLQNPLGVGGGTSGAATASSATYVNFNKLVVNSGTWTLQGPLVSGSTTLNGGVAQFNDNATFGSGLLTSNGGAIEASNVGLTLSNLMSLGAGGLSIQGANGVTLAGVLSGTGPLIKSGTGQLILNGANTYSGGTTLNAGSVQVGNPLSLGSGGVTVAGAATLAAPGTVNLANTFTLNNALSTSGAGALTLSGNLSGTGGLNINGSGSLTLTGNNAQQGPTALNGGTLLVGSNTALGAGVLNAAAGTTLDASADAALGNNINLGGNLTLGGSADLTLTGPVNGITGSLVKNGAANLVLNGNNGYGGGTTLNAGTLTAGSNTALGLGGLTVGGAATLDSNTAVTLGNNVGLNANLTLGGSNALTLGGLISGTGQLIKNGAGNLTLNGLNTFQGGANLNAGTLTLGNAGALGGGALTVGGAATLDNSAAFTLGNNIALNGDLTLAGNHNLNLSGVISGASGLIKNGAADLTLSGNNTFTGPLNVVSGSLTTVGAGALGNTSGASIGAGANLNLGTDSNLATLAGSGGLQIGAGTALSVGGVNSSSTFNGSLTGAGDLTKVGTGTLNLTGINGISGNTAVNAGTLSLTGSLGSAQVNVNSGGTFTGTGSVLGALNINNGGHLALSSGNTLSAGALNMVAGGNLDVALGAPSLTSLINVGGNVNLAGNLNASDAGGFGPGTYRLINYTGGLTGGLTVAGAPVGYGLGDLLVQTSVGNQVNLVVSTPNLRFWDGSQSVANGVVDGGTGTWTAGGANWTSADGLTNSPWASGFAVFTGAAGTVSVQGPQAFTGLQFVTDGYNLVSGAGGQLTAVNGTSGNVSMRVDPGATATIGVNINGTGTLNKLDTGTLVLGGANTYTGGTLLNGGTLVVGSNTALGSGLLTTAAGTTLDSNAAVSLMNPILLNGNTTVAGSNALTLFGRISGNGGLIKNGAGALTLTGTNTYTGGTTLNEGTLGAGVGNFGTGPLNVTGTGALSNAAPVGLPNAVNINPNAVLSLIGSGPIYFMGVLSGSGTVIVNRGWGLTLTKANTFSGLFDVRGTTLTASIDGALGVGATVNLNSATMKLELGASAALGALNGDGDGTASVSGGTLSVGTNNLDSAFNGRLFGIGTFSKIGSGVMTLGGVSSMTGTTLVSAGSLLVNGTLASTTVGVANGATLGGSGTVLGNVNIADGGHLALNSGNTLKVGSLVLGAGANVDAALGAPSTTPMLNVGNLTLDGNLNVRDAGGFGVGVYRLINYTGALTDQGLNVASVPVGYGLGDLMVQTSVGNQVNVLVSAPSTNVRFWDGSQLTPDGIVEGGTGTWSAGSTNWTSLDGLTNNAWSPLSFAVFQGAPGTVTVNGAQAITGLQFATDGYNVVGGAAGALTLVNGGSGNTAVRVDPNATATLGVTLNGGGTLAKLDAGTLVLNGANTYTGGTLLNGGTVVVGNNSALGSGGLTTANGTTLDSNTAVSLGNAVNLNGTLTVGGSNAMTLAGTLAGTGSLIKNGIANLTLSGNNSYAGPTALNAGGLILASNSALGAGALNAAAGTTLDTSSAVVLGNAVSLAGNLGILGSADLTLNGLVSGAGGLTKSGAGNLTLNGGNAYLGGTQLNAGSLTLGNGSALGTGGLTVNGAATLDNSAALALANNTTLNAALTVAGSNDLTLGGVVGGTGSLVKNGSANLILNGANTYSGGTTLAGGTLTVGNVTGLGSGGLTVSNASTLANSTPLVLANAVNLNGDLTVAGNNSLTLAGVLAGNAALIKNGAADLLLTGNNTFSGPLNVVGGSVTTVGNAALGNTSGVNLGTGASLNLGGNASLNTLAGNGAVQVAGGSTLAIGGSNLDNTFAGTLNGAGNLNKNGTGVLDLSGTNGISGAANVNGGTLNVSGSLASATVAVNTGATLTGTGALAGAVTVADGGHIGLNTDSTLSVGSLVLGNNANLDVGLGVPLVGGGNALLNVGGDLTLGGKLNVTDIGGFGSGVYTLINYGGALTNNGLALGTLPGSLVPGDLQVQTVVSNKVNLLVTAPNSNVQFWDGGNLTDNGAIDGGNGTWSTGTSNWTNVDGTLNQAWNNSFAVFQGTAGNVMVDGTQNITGMQFVTNGYNLASGTAGALNLVNGGSGNTVIRVDPNATATLGLTLGGAGTLAKFDTGTLVLNGNNTYTGGTALNGGALVVGNDNALGTGVLTAAGGTTLDNNAAVMLGNAAVLNGAMAIGGSHALVLNGRISGKGSLQKKGAATLTLNDANTYTGGTGLNAGQLLLGNNAALGTGALTVGGAASLDGSTDLQLANGIHLGGPLTLAGSNALALNGAISGTGSLVKNGNGALLLTGANTYSGGTTLNAGTTTGNAASLQGAIANNSTLTFEQGADGTYTGNLTGAGVLNKNGTGALLLTGNNSFTGNTNINAGSLLVNGTLNSQKVQLASGATLGGSGTLGGTVTMADGSTLKAGSAAPLSVGSLMMSAGTILDLAIGAPQASATAVIVADRLVLRGTLNVTNAGDIGAGVYQLFRYGSSLTSFGLTLGSLPAGLGEVSVQSALDHQINLVVQTTPGQIQFWKGMNTYPGGIIGGGPGIWGTGDNWTNPDATQAQVWTNQFAVFGGVGGVVTVEGNQSFTGLQFLDPGYKLAAGAGGTLSPTGTAPVRVSSGVIAEIAAPIVGAGAINKLDAGTLLLTGANTYSGGTTVSGGTLAGNTLSLQGRILNNARLLFVQPTNGTFNGTLTGTGTLSKQGAGALLLTGNQPFSGTASVDEGVLQVGNAANPGTVFGGQVTVANGAGLTGNGSVGSLVNNGSVTPDGGKLTVAGNFTNASTGALNLVITPSMTTSLAVGGTANLGGSLNVVNLVPYAGPMTYTLLTASAINGTFSTTNLENLAFLSTSLNYSPTQVALAVGRNNVSYASVAATGNQRGVAAALDSGTAVGGAAVQNALLTSDAAGARAAFDSLSGEIHASTASALLEDSRYIRDAVNERLRQPGCYREDDPRNSLAPSENRLSSAGCHGEMVGWMRVLGTWGHMGGDSNTAKLDRNLSGFLLGTDKQVDDAWRVGMAAGYTRSDLDAKRRSSSADVDSYHLMAYTAYQQEAFAARMGVAYSWHDIESKRDVAVGGAGQRLKADYKARSAQVFGEVGYTLETRSVVVEPFAGLAYVNYHSDTLKEKGGSAALRGDADQDVTFSTLGVRIGQTLTLGNGSKITPRGSIGWRHAFGDTKPDADLSFINGGGSFSTQGVPIAKDSAVVEAGVDYQISQNGKLGLGYSGQLSRNDKDHAMTISFSLGF